MRHTFTPYHRDKFRGQKNVDDVFAVNDRRDTYTISANGRHMARDLITNFQDGDTIDLPGDYENGGSFIKPIFKTKSSDKNIWSRAQVIRPGQVGCIQLENGYYYLVENYGNPGIYRDEDITFLIRPNQSHWNGGFFVT